MLGDVRSHDCLIRSRLNVVVRDGTEVRLEPKAMSVLVLLVERQSEVVSREDILSAVWGDRFVSDEVLTNAVSQVRRALGDSARTPRFIQTIAKGGYRFVAPVRAAPNVAGRRRALLAVGAAACIVLLAAVGVEWSGSSSAVLSVTDGLVEVGEFDSLSGDDELEWLRSGIADLMVTGLSRTPRLRVVGPSHHEEAVVAAPVRAQWMVGGSYARLDGELRVDAYARDTTTGEIVVAESVQARSPAKLFDIVDELAARVSMRLTWLHDDEPHLKRALREITTDSIEAYRHYVEGMRRYYYNLDHVGAIEYYEKAVEIDPSFAMAYAKMSLVYLNAGDIERADHAARTAIEHIDRLPRRQRHYVTGNFYVTREVSYARALEAYDDALELDPGHLAARHNRAFIYFRLERYREAAQELETLVHRGVGFPGSYRLLMLSYAALGEFENGRRVADVYLARHPDKWIGHRNLGQHLMRWGRLEEASAALTRADALRPGALPAVDWWQLNLLRQEPVVAFDAEPLVKSAEPKLGRAMQQLYAGLPREAIEELDRTFADEDGASWASVALNLSAAVKLQIGDVEAGFETARRARELGRGSASEWHALSLASVARAKLGDWDGARGLAAELERRTAALPSQKERRRIHQLRGELASVAGEPSEAVDALSAAESLLAPRGFPITMQLPQHVPIRYARAEAHREAGEIEQASRWYRSVTESTTERLVWPILYVRSFYRLGSLHENGGDLEQAIECYRQFLSYWEDGELDRQDVETARSKVAAFDARRPIHRASN